MAVMTGTVDDAKKTDILNIGHTHIPDGDVGVSFCVL